MPLPSLGNPSQQPRSNGHSTGSSLSSAFSEPTSPHGFPGHSYSPSRQANERSAMEYRNRAAPNLPFSPRDEQSHHLGTSHHRAHTLPSLPHSSPTALGQPFGYPAHQPVPMHPSTDPFFARPGAPYGHQHLAPEYAYDRPRYDSQFPSELLNHAAYGNFYAGGSHSLNSARKRRGNLPKDATKCLREWFREHEDSPYPSEEEKLQLCEQTQLQISQVRLRC